MRLIRGHHVVRTDSARGAGLNGVGGLSTSESNGMRTRVDVSVVVGANPSLVFDCLRSFFEHMPADCDVHIRVVCNRKDTGTTEALRENFHAHPVEVVENTAPVGFAENHNRTLRESSADYVLILNDDVIFRSGCIGALIDFMHHEDNQDVAMVSPRLLNGDGTVQPSTYSFPTVLHALLSVSGVRDWVPFSPALSLLARLVGRGDGRSRFWAHDETVTVDTFKGACMLARMSAVREVGLMHIVSLAGGEETEWHYRLRRAGWRVVFFVGAEVVHLGGKTRQSSVTLQNEELKSYLYYFGHHRSRATLVAFAASAFVLLRLRWIGERLRGGRASAAATLEGTHIIVRTCRSALRQAADV